MKRDIHVLPKGRRTNVMNLVAMNFWRYQLALQYTRCVSNITSEGPEITTCSMAKCAFGSRTLYMTQ